LLRWYPRAWRARYGEEFTELLLADLAERPRSAARTADVIRGGFVARLADAGLCGCAPQVPELARAQARAGLASIACCAAVFLGVGGAIWSQLVIGWQWSAPATAGTVVATFRDDRNGPGPRPADAARRAAGGVDRGDSARGRPGP
jgi:hypothetical protein